MNKSLFDEAVASIGSDRQVARAIGRSGSLVSLIRTGERRLTLDVARAIEEATHGRFRAADLLGLTTTSDRAP